MRLLRTDLRKKRGRERECVCVSVCLPVFVSVSVRLSVSVFVPISMPDDKTGQTDQSGREDGGLCARLSILFLCILA